MILSSRFSFAVSLAAALVANGLSARAAVITTLTTSGVNSNGGSFGSAATGKYTYTVAGLDGTYMLESITFGATVDKVASADAAGEKRVGVTAGSTSTSGFNPGFPTYAGTPARSTVNNVAWNITDSVISNGTVITFQFYESINDGGDAGIDATYSALSLALNGSPFVVTAPTVPAANQFGTLSGNGLTASKPASIFSTGEVDWYSFSIDKAVNAADAYRYLDLDTNSITGTTALDTELALYAADGTLIANDDEDGTGTKSALSFGAGNLLPQNPGDTTPVLSNGRDGATLAAGTYYIAVAPFNASFANNFLVTGTGSSSGGYNMNVTLGPAAVVVPEPATLVIATASVSLVTRRRRG